MKLLGSTISNISKTENGPNVPNLKVTQIVLVHCIIVNNNYQQNSRVLCTFIPNNSCSQLLNISPNLLKTFNSEFSLI